MKLGHLDISQGHIKWAAEGTFTALSLFSLMITGAYFATQEKLNAAQSASPALAFPIRVEAPIEAKSAIVYDTVTGEVLFARYADVERPLASLTKLMSAEAILSVKNETERVSITADDLRPEGDSGLKVGDIWSLKNLLTYGLVQSSNDAMAAAAASAGTSSIVSRMNEVAAELGLTHARFENPTGLDIDTESAGAYGSARDIALLAADFLKRYPELFSKTVSPKTEISVGGVVFEAKPTAAPILDIPGLLGAKTGYTDLAGGNLVAAFDLSINHPVVVVVLGSSVEGRFSDVRSLIEATRLER